MKKPIKEGVVTVRLNEVDKIFFYKACREKGLTPSLVLRFHMQRIIDFGFEDTDSIYSIKVAGKPVE
jgi:hypothetical protein